MRARVPADVDMADRIFAGLTARQLAILGGCGVVVLAIYALVGERAPVALFAALAAPVAVVGLVWATTSPEGTTWERLGMAALRHFRVPRRRVLAPEGVEGSPEWFFGAEDPLGALDLPVKGVPDGHVDLGSQGAVAVCRASSVNLALRSEEEQGALVEGFARLLNSLDGPVQFLVRSGRADPRAALEALEERAAALPHPALERAAREHAGFLRSLASRRDVLERQVLACFREPVAADDEDRAAVLAHRTEEAAALLRGMGVRLVRLEAEESTELLVRACDPEAAPPPRGTVLGEAVVEGAW